MVWNRGTPPNPRTALDSQVPVRVRVEPRNSMNNRFRPDAGIKFRWGWGVLVYRLHGPWRACLGMTPCLR